MKKPLCYLFVVTLFSSCDLVLLPFDLEPPATDPEIVLQAVYMHPLDSVYARGVIRYDEYRVHDSLEFQVGTSRDVLDTLLTISLSLDGLPLGDFRQTKYLPGVEFLHALPFDKTAYRPGSRLVIEASHPVFGTARAEQIAPEKVPLREARYVGILGLSDNVYFPDDLYHGVEVSLTDPPGANYYQVSVIDSAETSWSKPYIWTRTIQIDDVPFAKELPFGGAYVFSDGDFDSNELTFVIKVIGELQPNTKVALMNITKEFYEYQVSLAEHATYNEVSLTFISGFVQLNSIQANVEGGQGYFGVGFEEWFDIEQ